MSPWSIFVPCLFFFALIIGSIFLHPENKIHLTTPLNSFTYLHITAFLAWCALHTLFILLVRKIIQSLTRARDNYIELANQKTKILREEIRQHKAARSELQRLATHDQLTGAKNRRHFSDTLASEIVRFKRYRNNFSLLILDIDDFQGINDLYGHDCGDFILQKFAQYVQKNLRQSDVFVRYGGQEFAIIATNTEIDSAKRFADKLSQSIEIHGIYHEATTIHLTVSIGVASPSQLNQLSAQSLIQSAETALRAAKASGKNQAVCVSEVN